MNVRRTGKRSVGRLDFAAKVGLTIVVALVLLHFVGWSEVGQALSRVSVAWLFLMYCVAICRWFVSAFQLRTLLRWVGAYVTTGRVFLANALAALYSLAIPGDAAAAAAKWIDLSAATRKGAVVFGAMVYNRLALLLPILAFGVVGLIWDNPFGHPALPVVALACLTLVSAGSLALFHPRLGIGTDPLMKRGAKLVPGRLFAPLQRVIAALQTFRDMKTGEHLGIVSLGLALAVIQVCTFTLAAYAAGVSVPIPTLAWTLALIIVVCQFPITVSNLGVREGLLVLVLGPYGVSPETAIAMGLVAFSNQLVLAGIGLGYQFTLAFRRAHSSSDSSSTLRR